MSTEKQENAMVMTKDGEQREDLAVALNHRRVAALARLVRQDQLPNFTGDAKLEAEKLAAELAKAEAEKKKAEEELVAAESESQKVVAKVRVAEATETASKIADRMKKVRIVKTAEAHLRTLSDKGPLALVFASEDSTAAAPYQQFYGSPDRSTFPVHFGLGETPPIFVPYLAAKSAWDELTAKRERERKERETAELNKRAEAADQKIAAANERARQAEADLALMDALDAESDPGLQSKVDGLREKRKAEQDREREERDKRLVNARGDLIALVDGKMHAAGFYDKKRGRYLVADADKRILSIGRLAGYNGAPGKDIASSLPSSQFSGKAGDTYNNGKDERCAWTIGSFTFILTDKNDRPIMIEVDGKKVPATATGFAVLRAGKDYTDSEASQLKRLVTERGRGEDWDTFRKAHYLRDLDKTAKWASDLLSGNGKNRRDEAPQGAAPQGDTPAEGSKPARRDRGNGKRSASDNHEGPKEGKPKAEPPKPEIDSAETETDESDSNDAAPEDVPRPMEERTNLPPGVSRDMPRMKHATLADKLKAWDAKPKADGEAKTEEPAQPASDEPSATETTTTEAGQ